MNRKTVSGMMVTLLLIGMVTLAVDIQETRADWTWTETIHIRAGGSVEPDTAPISTYDNVTYTLADNIVGDVPEESNAIIVERDNIVIDGAGHTLQGTGTFDSKGIVLIGTSNVTIRNMEIRLFDDGIWLEDSSYTNVSGSKLADNYVGIFLLRSYNTSISRNNMANTWEGIDLWSSHDNVISGNKLTSHILGIWFYHSGNNSLSENNIKENGYGIMLGESSSNTISGNNITDNGEGVSLSGSPNNSISGNNIANNGDGINIDSSSNSVIYKNNITNNIREGILLSYSLSNTISINNIKNNSRHGICLLKSSNSNISRNNITSNNWHGIYLTYYSDNNSVSGNSITNNDCGICLGDSSNNSISGNGITNNGCGITLYFSSSNSIYHNNLVDNTQQVYDYSWDYPDVSPSINTWDNSYPSGGNYWSDQDHSECADRYIGPDQDIPGSDGIVDTPYVIDEDNRDNYPLMEPWRLIVEATADFDPDTLNLRSHGRWVTAYIELPEGYSVGDIDVSSVRLNEIFPIDPHAPTQIGDYDSDGVPDLMVKFNRTELTSYLYGVLGARLDDVTLTVSGQLTDGTPFEDADTVRTRLAGDVNGDAVVDVTDLSIVGRSYGARIDEDRHEEEIDFNGDGIIDMREVIVIGINYGATIPE